MSEVDGGRPSFDLVSQPWLLAHRLDGSTCELSLLEVFTEAHRLRGLAGDVSTQVFAVTRLLLAILHRAVDGPRDRDAWRALWRAEELPVEAVRAYLDKYRDRFDLLHPVTPFFQVAGLRTAKGEVTEVARLVADVPNNHKFFSSRQGEVALGFGEAARWLVHCHAYDPSGIKSGAQDDERVKGGKGYPIGTGWCGYLGGVLPEGATLRETLLLNLLPHNQHPGYQPALDLPVWERAPDSGGEREAGQPIATGPIDLFTWQSRRLRLVVDGEAVTAVLICNGDRITPQNKHPVETHSGWRRSKPQETKLRIPTVYMPLEHRPERMIWRGLDAMLPTAPAQTTQRAEAAARLRPTVLEWISELTTNRVVPKDLMLRVRVFGMTYGPQSSTTTEIIDDALALRTVLLGSDATDLTGAVLSSVTAAESAARALGSLGADLAIAAGQAGLDKGTAARTRALESAYAVLDPLFREWIATLAAGTDPLDCQFGWQRTVRHHIARLGETMVAAAPPSAWTGHVDSGTKRLVTSVHADGWFRRGLREALPYAHPTIEQDEDVSAATTSAHDHR
ncbi:CRISPR-associated protein, Cse1 family [Alloactinosynnema sp. L-07]|uniref:type I-E CRISPR-associated protein Cse1/CasA n=1 Tax=Alloactinosynnema sp. L-07 TaxID=1653480 RepID=UPI00065EFB95|nr:type I-E CRISPR-associated protein Cse1/CasA [Alloactinosynnema sp. L-07]CRK59251.1 CRISPR-associated protein, Cse1 family [Alloactinosynnema sp. L-07]